MQLLNKLLHHIVIDDSNQSILFIGFSHPGDTEMEELKQVIKYQFQGEVSYSPVPFQSYYKFDTPGRIQLIKECKSDVLNVVNDVLALLDISLVANIIRHVQSIVPNDDISLLNRIQKGIRYPLEKYFQVDCFNVNSNEDGSGVSGLGFYPVGRGLSKEGQTIISDKKFMILGHDFGGYKGYSKAIKEQEESKNGPTWRRLLSLLNKAGIHEDDCFFTNAIMGQRRVELKSIKNDSWVQEEDFKNDCLDFLKVQLIVQQPDVVLVLGKEAFPILNKLHPFLDKLKSSYTFSDFDASPISDNICGLIIVDFIPNKPLRFVYLVHPSYRHLNVKTRRFIKSIGDEAEQEMIKNAIQNSNSNN